MSNLKTEAVHLSRTQRIAEAARLLAHALTDNKIVLANQAKAIKDAKRMQKRWSKAARVEFIKSKASV